MDYEVVTMTRPKIGLLPMYAELYDRAAPEKRPTAEAFLRQATGALEQRGLEVLTAPVCRLKGEFASAVKSFEDAGVDTIVTLHLTYSPSLESSDVLAATRLPIIVLDTSPTYEFGPEQVPTEIFSNHGIHGVQDMCNLLIRNGKPFQIEAGHWEHSDVVDRVAGWARAASIAARIRSARVGRIGKPFDGMGDFAIPTETLRSTIGIETIVCDSQVIRSLMPSEDDPEVEAEMAADRERFAADGLDAEAHRRTVRTCLAVRRWIAKENLSAFTMNFMVIDKASGLPVVPFLEASKAMARGIGYAGEGDIPTAALVSALASVHPDVTFTEIFCADWKGNRIFLSHMGELNLNLVAGKPQLMERPFPWTDAGNPVVALGRFRGGQAVLVNLAPGPDDTYTLIAAPVEMIDVEGEDKMAGTVHGWFRPPMPIADFLARYSRLGGTHHSALVYGEVAEDVAKFGKLMGWNVVLLDRGQA